MQKISTFISKEDKISFGSYNTLETLHEKVIDITSERLISLLICLCTGSKPNEKGLQVFPISLANIVPSIKLVPVLSFFFLHHN